MPMGDDELKWLLKEGGGYIFESCDICFENTPTHIVSLAIFMYAHSATSVLLACTVAWVYFREKSTFIFERLWKDGVHLDVSHCFVQDGQALRLNQKRYGECGRTL